MKSTRIVALILCLSLALPVLSVFSFAKINFVDVTQEDYYNEPIQWAVKNNITKGTSDNEFSPNSYCTRSQVVTFLYRASGEPEIGTVNNKFVDVKETDYFYAPVMWALSKGITNGTTDKTFEPEAECTRAQILSLIWRSIGELSASSANPFIDVKKGEYYYSAVLWAIEKGITTGVSNNSFDPEGTCTRGQVITFIYRAVHEQGYYIGGHHIELKTYPNDGRVFDLIGGRLLQYYKSYTSPGCSAETLNGLDEFFPTPVSLSWKAYENATEYIVSVSLKESMIDAQTFSTTDTEKDIYDLFTGRDYYYTITAKTPNGDFVTGIHTFKTAKTLRTLRIGTAANGYVSNVRDIGGTYVNDGAQRVKQGMAYRGAALDYQSTNSRDIVYDVWYRYQFKTELDLRTGSESTPAAAKINHISVRAPYYLGTTGIDSASYQEALKIEIQTFANIDNYPIYFHCAIGRDRTGTLAAILNAILGVSEKDIMIDYEASFLSASGSNDRSVATPTYMTGVMRQTLNWIRQRYPSETLQESATKFALAIGVTQEEIDSIRNILLEDVE